MHSRFEQGFLEAYKNANPRKRRRVLPYLQAIHRRWYYSTLVENTPFTPANLMESVFRHYNECPDRYPVALLRTPAKVTGVDSLVLEYTAKKHPIIDDMRKIMSFCTPHVDLLEVGCFSEEQSLESAKQLSLNDPHYASFLLDLAIFMKLLTKVPAIYVTRMQPSKKLEETMGESDEEILREMVEATISITTQGLRGTMPMPESVFTEAFVRGLLSRPMETDEIFFRVFDSLGYDIDDVLELHNEPVLPGATLESLGHDMELMSGMFVLGIMLDRFFFTPFGHFLRVIRPMYVMPFSFQGEMNDYVKVCDDPDETFVAFFAPCSSYTLTELGLEIFGIEKTPENFFDTTDFHFETMKDVLFHDSASFAMFIEVAQQISPVLLSGGLFRSIYTFRVRHEAAPSIWMHLQVPDNMTLHQLYEEASGYFNIKENEDYSFFHDKTENRFAEYPSPKRAGRAKNPRTTADDVFISDIDYDHINQLIMVAYNQSSPFSPNPPAIRLHLELLSIKDPEDNEDYPRVARMSKDMKNT